jgi:hypothetical protein
MFKALRVAAVIGVIAYLSPVRQEAGDLRLQDILAWGRDRTTGAAPADAGGAGLWRSLPEPARRALVEGAAESLGAGPPISLPAAHDTLRPDDLRPSWRGPAARSP